MSSVRCRHTKPSAMPAQRIWHGSADGYRTIVVLPGLKIGKERVTDAGRVDITATDAKRNFIIELKAGIAQPAAVTQILAYMGAIGATDRA